jgi:hypothetical protein
MSESVAWAIGARVPPGYISWLEHPHVQRQLPRRRLLYKPVLVRRAVSRVRRPMSTVKTYHTEESQARFEDEGGGGGSNYRKDVVCTLMDCVGIKVYFLFSTTDARNLIEVPFYPFVHLYNSPSPIFYSRSNPIPGPSCGRKGKTSGASGVRQR